MGTGANSNGEDVGKWAAFTLRNGFISVLCAMGFGTNIPILDTGANLHIQYAIAGTKD